MYSLKAEAVRLDGDAGKKLKETLDEFADTADKIKGDLGRIAADVAQIYAAIQAL